MLAGVPVDVAEGAIEEETGGVTDGVGVAEHAAYARELHNPGMAAPPEQQSQQILPEAGHSAHEYCALATTNPHPTSRRSKTFICIP